LRVKISINFNFSPKISKSSYQQKHGKNEGFPGKPLSSRKQQELRGVMMAFMGIFYAGMGAGLGPFSIPWQLTHLRQFFKRLISAGFPHPKKVGKS